MTHIRIVRAALPLVLLAGAAAAPHAQAEDDLTFYYVASAVGAGSDVPDMVPVVKDTHPLGWFSFASPGSSFTLTLDDTGTVTGATIPVVIWGDTWSARLCIPARTPTRVFGGTRGAEVGVFVDSAVDAALDLQRRCTGSGTTGTANVRR
jgi:hypothetical protein